jgi:hypothetical protein
MARVYLVDESDGTVALWCGFCQAQATRRPDASLWGARS